MNDKGFTLVELILVVAIIALLSLIFTPNVLYLINKNNTDTYNDTVESVISATKIYVSNNRYDLGITCTDNKKNITLNELILSGDLSKLPVNPCKNSSLDFDVNDIVEVSYDCNKKKYDYKFRDKINEQMCNSG